MMTKADTPVAKIEPTMESHTENNSTSHQFNNVLGSGHTNNDTINMTHTGNLSFWINVSAFFHEPLLGEQGYVRIVLMDNNTEVFNNVTSTSIKWANMSNLTQKNLTVITQAVGSDGTITGESVADWYVVDITAHVVWESEV